MTRGARGRANVSGVRGREVVDGPRSREVLEGGRSRQVLLGPRSRNTGGLPPVFRDESLALWLDSKYSVSGEPRVINRGAGDRTGVSGAVIYNGAYVSPINVGVQGLQTTIDTTDEYTVTVRCSASWQVIDATARRLFCFENGEDVRFHNGDIIFESSSVAAPWANGTIVWLKITRTATTSEIAWAADQTTEPTSWTVLASSGTTADPDTTQLITIGNFRLSGALDRCWPGDIYRFIFRNSGVDELDVDMSLVPNWSSSFTATTGQTVTLNTTAAAFGTPSALDAKYGSVLGTYVYDGAIVNAAAINNQASVPDNANLLLDDEFELVAHIAPDSWTTDKTIFGHSDAGGSRGWSLAFQTLGTPRLFVSTSGGLTNLPATAAVPFTAGQAGWVKATWIRNNGSGQYEIKYYTAADQPTEPSSWTQLGSTVTGATFAANATGPAVNVSLNGWASTANNWAGRYYRAIVRDGIDGTTVLDVDLTNVADYATSFTATTGQTVTVNSTSSDTNDPLLLAHTGENYAHNGVANGANGLSFTDGSAVAATSQFVLTGRVRANGDRTSHGQWVSTGDHRGLLISLGASSTDTVIVRWTEDGIWDGGTRNVIHTFASADFRNNEWFWFQVEVDFANDDIIIRWAEDQPTRPTTWAEEAVKAAPVAIDAVYISGSTPFNLWGAEGAGGSVEGFNGLKYLAVESDGLTSDFEFNAVTDITDAGATSFTATSGQTVTVSRATSGRKTVLVTRPVWLFGTDDFLEVADNALLDFAASQDFSVLAVYRGFGTPAAAGAIFTKGQWGVITEGWSIVRNTVSATQTQTLVVDSSGGSTYSQTTPTGLTANDLTSVLLQRSGAHDYQTYTNVTLGTNGTDTNTGGSVSTAQAVRVGAQAAGLLRPYDGEIVAVAVWRRVLTADEIAAINTYYGTV